MNKPGYTLSHRDSSTRSDTARVAAMRGSEVMFFSEGLTVPELVPPLR